MTGNIPRNYDRRDGGSRAEAQAAFRSFMAKPTEVPAAIPSASEGEQVVWLRITKDVLAYFKPEKDGWQDRMSTVLRKSAGL